MLTRYIYVGQEKSKRPLVIDKKKQLWLMRMVVGEGGRDCSREKTSALCCAIINRWFLWPGHRFYSTFIGMLRAFSQPINPRWIRGGDLAEKYKDKPAGSDGRLRRRARIIALRWNDIPDHIRVAVCDFANGNLLPPEIVENGATESRISNWASLKSTPKKYPWGVDVDGDWFFEDKNLKDGGVYIENTVRIPLISK